MIQHIAAWLASSANHYRSLDYAIYHRLALNLAFDAVPQIPAASDIERHHVGPLLPIASNLTSPGKMLYVEGNRTLITSGGGTGPMKPGNLF
jgi:hypothetical protein